MHNIKLSAYPGVPGVCMQFYRFQSLAFCFLLLVVGGLASFPQQTSPSAQKALALQQEGQLHEAEEIWRSITLQHSEDVQAWADLGLVRAMQGHYPEAIPAYQEALKLNPRLPGLQFNLGLAFFKRQQPDSAIAAFKAAAAQDPGDARVAILLGTIYYGSARYAEAIPYLERAVSSSPTNPQLRMALAQSCLSLKKYDCTLDQYKQMLLQNPESAQAYMLAGEAFDGLDRTEEAIAQFREAEKVGPNELNVHHGLAYLLWKQRRFDEAEAEFKLELENDPNSTSSLAYLGDIALKHDDEAAAMTLLKRAAALPGAIRLTYVDLGILHAQLNQNEEAEASLERAVRMDPTEADAHWRLARLYQTMGEKEKAKREMQKVLALNK
jgi:tetratricopeptide (TPR) repeat protein